jgi:hypothetical protein
MRSCPPHTPAVCSKTGGGIDGLSEFELNAALQDALVAGGKARLLRISAHMLPPAAPTASSGGGGGGRQPLPPALSRVQQLGRLRLRVEPGWPLSLVVGEDMLRQYNAVLVLLLQLRWVKQSLQSVRYHGWKAGQRRQQQQAAGQQRDALQHQVRLSFACVCMLPACLPTCQPACPSWPTGCCLRCCNAPPMRLPLPHPPAVHLVLPLQMVHLVDSVLQYITDRVVAAGSWLEAAMQDCSTLDAMHACCAKYLRAVTRYCLLRWGWLLRVASRVCLLFRWGRCWEQQRLFYPVQCTTLLLHALLLQLCCHCICQPSPAEFVPSLSINPHPPACHPARPPACLQL